MGTRERAISGARGAGHALGAPCTAQHFVSQRDAWHEAVAQAPQTERASEHAGMPLDSPSGHRSAWPYRECAAEGRVRDGQAHKRTAVGGAVVAIGSQVPVHRGQTAAAILHKP